MSTIKNTLLNNRYIPIKKIGSGSFSIVWLTFDINTLKYYALKVQNSKDYNDALHELTVYEYLKNNCNNIMNIYDAFEIKHDTDNDILPNICMVMDLMTCSSHLLLKTNKYNNGLDIPTVIRIIKHVLVDLCELHKNGIVHKDIKPENILILDMFDVYHDIKQKLKLEKIVKKHSKGKQKLDKCAKNNIVNEISNKNCNNDSDSDSDSDNDDSDNYDSNSNSNSNNIDINNITLNKNIIVKIGDMGHCMLPGIIFEHKPQPNYYLAPEILMKLEYDTSADMWALGCTIYELLTGNILFDSEYYNGNTYRHHLYMIVEKLGMFCQEDIKKSPEKDIFFNKQCTFIKGHRGIKFQRPLWKDLKEICEKNSLSKTDEQTFINFMMLLFKYNIKERLTAENALHHDIFNMEILHCSQIDTR